MPAPSLPCYTGPLQSVRTVAERNVRSRKLWQEASASRSCEGAENTKSLKTQEEPPEFAKSSSLQRATRAMGSGAVCSGSSEFTSPPGGVNRLYIKLTHSRTMYQFDKLPSCP